MRSTRTSLPLLLFALPLFAGENQVLNGDFDSDLAHWSVFGSDGSVSFDAARGSPNAGSARFSCTYPQGLGLALYQCFPTTGNLNQRFAGRLRLGQGSLGFIPPISLRFFASNDCSGNPIAAAVTSQNLGNVPGVLAGEFYAVLNAVTRSPAAARSAWLFVACSAEGSRTPEFFADHLLTEPDDVFAGSFE